MTRSELLERSAFPALAKRREGGLALCIAGLAVVLLTAGCAARAAEAPAGGPALQVPAPPNRVLAPVEDPPVATAPIPESPPEATPPRLSRPPADTRPAPPAAAAPAPAPTPPAAPAPPAVAPPAIPRDLRAPSPANAATERDVRDVLARAARDINQVDYNRLSPEGKSQYEQSKRFSIQAEQALRERNLIFAVTLADKAATLAAELAAR